jgi:uncharacterized protein (DUF433 family)
MASLDPFRTGPAYSVNEAARYAGTTSQTVRRWIDGYDYRDRHMDPVFADKATGTGQAPLLSFLDLAEILVAARFTKNGGKLEKVRAARKRIVHDHPDLPYPFASLRLRQLSGEILHHIDDEMGGKALALSLGGTEGSQYVLQPFIEQALDLFDFDPLDMMATRWYPRGKTVPVVIDPHVAGGRLSVVGYGVTVDTIHARFFRGDQTIEFIARDFDLNPDLVEEVIRLSPQAAPLPA